jgi:hypothetical protein
MTLINQSILGSQIPTHDHVTLDPADKPVTITYRKGGASGEIVAELTLTYDGDNISTLERTE